MPERTVRRWDAEWPELAAERMAATEEMMLANVAVAQRVKARQPDWYEKKVEKEPLTVGEATFVNASGRTDTDKLHHRQDLRRGGVKIGIFVVREDPGDDVVEGEVVERE